MLNTIMPSVIVPNVVALVAEVGQVRFEMGSIENHHN
jgi:hypothetical protein